MFERNQRLWLATAGASRLLRTVLAIAVLLPAGPVTAEEAAFVAPDDRFTAGDWGVTFVAWIGGKAMGHDGWFAAGFAGSVVASGAAVLVAVTNHDQPLLYLGIPLAALIGSTLGYGLSVPNASSRPSSASTERSWLVGVRVDPCVLPTARNGDTETFVGLTLTASLW